MKRNELWVSWLESRSLFKRIPGLVWLLPYLLGICLWRLSYIRPNWHDREMERLPYLIILIAFTLFWFRSYWWRLGIIVKAKPVYLGLFVLLLMGGYG